MDKRRGFIPLEITISNRQGERFLTGPVRKKSSNGAGFTLIELLVALLMPALERAREQAQRAVCLNNLHQLTLAWLLYADDNDDKIVNGATGFSDTDTGWGKHIGEIAWVDAFPSDWDTAIQGIKDGALWPYTKNVRLYRCPTGLAGEAMTYSIMFSMNAVNHS